MMIAGSIHFECALLRNFVNADSGHKQPTHGVVGLMTGNHENSWMHHDRQIAGRVAGMKREGRK